MNAMRLQVTTTTLSTPDAQVLAAFYEQLLGWERSADEPDWVKLRPPGGGHALGFHHDAAYRAPHWPSTLGRQQMMVHLEIGTDDLAAAVEHAIACGAVEAPVQPQSGVRVMFDPDGHPFCLFAEA